MQTTELKVGGMPMAQKKLSRPAKPSTSRPLASAVFTYSLPSASVKASSSAWLAPASCMRQGEICQLLAEDADLERKTVPMRDRKDPRNKIGNNQVVPLLPDALAIIKPLVEHRNEGFVFGVAASSDSTAFSRACKAVKPPIVDLHFHAACPQPRCTRVPESYGVGR